MIKKDVALTISCRQDIPQKVLDQYADCVRFMTYWIAIHTGRGGMLAEEILEQFKQNVGLAVFSDDEPKGKAN